MIAMTMVLLIASQSPAQPEDNFCSLARRNPDGSWTLLGSLTLDNDEGHHKLAPGSVYKPGHKVGRLDIAKTLDTPLFADASQRSYKGAVYPHSLTVDAFGSHTVFGPATVSLSLLWPTSLNWLAACVADDAAVQFLQNACSTPEVWHCPAQRAGPVDQRLRLRDGPITKGIGARVSSTGLPPYASLDAALCV